MIRRKNRTPNCCALHQRTARIPRSATSAGDAVILTYRLAERATGGTGNVARQRFPSPVEGELTPSQFRCH